MDRNDLIKALGNAFESPKEEPATPSSHVESANVGEKDVLRLLTDYQSKGSLASPVAAKAAPAPASR